MQYKSNFIRSSILLIFLIALYFICPCFFNMFDEKVFLFLNKFFLKFKFSQYVFGFLSHKNESWINIIVMFGVNIVSIFICNYNFLIRKKLIFRMIYCVLSFQVILLTNYIVFQNILYIRRNSPSVILDESIRLSVVLNNLDIKDYSNNSFPAGHALILIYWILFVNLQDSKVIKIISWVLGGLFVLPRLVTGAHWLSDTIFSLLLGYIYFNISMWFANNYEQIKKRIY